MKRFMALCLATLVVGAMLQPSATQALPSPAVSAAADTASARTAAKGEALSKFKCKKFENRSTVGKRCAKLSILNERFDVDYQRTFFNKSRKKSVQFTCSTSKQETYTFSASVTASVEAGVIFSKVAASATAGVSKSYTTTDSASGTFKVKPRKYAHCERGTYIYDFKGVFKTVTCNASGCRTTKKNFKGKAPSRDFFAIGPGRG